MPTRSPSTNSRPAPVNVAYDTSGVDPSADLTITGSVTWAGGWGINVGAGGKAQATTAASSKIYNMIQATGEFSVEAWVAPALVAVDNSYMVSYSGGDTTRNFTLGQTNQHYDFIMRSSDSDLNGMPQLRLRSPRCSCRPPCSMWC